MLAFSLSTRGKEVELFGMEEKGIKRALFLSFVLSGKFSSVQRQIFEFLLLLCSMEEIF